MEKITNYFNLCDATGRSLSQSNVRFVNLYLGQDNRIFLDFNRILKQRDDLSIRMQIYLSSFMYELSQKVFQNDEEGITKMLNGIHESNSTFLGYSRKRPDGNSVGKVLIEAIKENLDEFRDTILAGNFDINMVYFGISKISADRTSDILSSILKQLLIDFTKEQCIIHSIPMHNVAVKNIYNQSTNTWDNKIVQLPLYEGSPIILIPKEDISSQGLLQGTFNRFITLGFNAYFKTNEDYINLIAPTKNEIMRKEFDEYNKSNHINRKMVSKTLFKKMTNENMVNLLADLRLTIPELGDDEIEMLIEKHKLRKVS